MYDKVANTKSKRQKMTQTKIPLSMLISNYCKITGFKPFDYQKTTQNVVFVDADGNYYRKPIEELISENNDQPP
jgi:hypothetical protein